eukprot:404662_1
MIIIFSNCPADKNKIYDACQVVQDELTNHANIFRGTNIALVNFPTDRINNPFIEPPESVYISCVVEYDSNGRIKVRKDNNDDEEIIQFVEDQVCRHPTPAPTTDPTQYPTRNPTIQPSISPTINPTQP